MRLSDDLMAELERVVAAENRAASYHRTDTGTARALLDHFGRDLLAVRGTYDEWATWDGERWVFRKSGQLTVEFERAVSTPLQRAAAESPEDEALARWANTCSNTSKMVAGIRHAHNLAQTAERGLSVDLAEFDTAPELLGVTNGVLDLSGDEPVVRPRTRDLLLTKSTSCEFDPDATHEAFTEYLDRFLPEPDLREFVQRVLGYAAVRDGNPERLMVWLRGETSTGKSTLVEWTHKTLGTGYSMATDPSMFREKREAGATSELAHSLSKRFLGLSEFGSSSSLHVSIIKRLTGSESISARRAHSPVVEERIPAFTPVVATNDVPRVDDPDGAFKRRLMVVPFRHQAPPDASKSRVNDPETYPAVLAWLVRGYFAYKRDGVAPDTWPGAVRDETNETFFDLSPGDRFWDECVEVDPTARVLAHDFTSAFREWQGDQGIDESHRLTLDQFKQWVAKEKGWQTKPRQVAGKNARFYVGLRLREAE
ncbi:hypothetical protein G6020_10700 [Dietzia sp. B19]|uniref:DNA primase family protein n=1 Tax=Dietzia sp. B19 TaxID=1630632 RepID=UPI0015FA3D56|nr:phage/plasmid primase, P4 family [Dietzia sp. B19]MBB1057852.1 hypothetical protein [Dietzia sp. B19]